MRYVQVFCKPEHSQGLQAELKAFGVRQLQFEVQHDGRCYCVQGRG